MATIGRKSSSSKSASSKADSPVKEKAVSKPTVKKEAKKAATPKVIEQFMHRFTKDTPGTLRFESVSKTGEVLKASDAEINQLYVRRSSPAMGGDPRFLKITVEVLDKLPGSVEDED